MKKYIEEAKRNAARAIAKNAKLTADSVFDDVLPLMDELQKTGASLHSRYENLCNGFPWDKDGSYTEKYERATDKKEEKIIQLCAAHGIAATHDVNERREGVFIMLQRDPRGWPIVLYVSGREYRLGGKCR